MKKKLLAFFAVLLLVLPVLSVTASAELMDTETDPAPVVSGGSFEASSGTKMEFNVSGGTLTGAKWTTRPHHASYNLTGTFKEGETVSLSITGTEAPGLAESATSHLVWNGLSGYIDYYADGGSRIGETQRYQSEYVKSSPLSHAFTATIPAGAKEMVIQANFVCRWSVDYSLAVVEEFVAVSLNLEVEREESPVVMLPADPEPSKGPGPDPYFTPDQITQWGEDCDCEGPWTHAGPLATIFIAIVSALAAIFGGGIGSVAAAAGEAAGGMSGGWDAESPPERDMIITDPATGAQTRFVQDPATGEWVDPERGSILDPSRVPGWQQERTSEREWIDRQNDSLRTGDNALDRHIAEDRERQAAAEALSDELLRIAKRAHAQPASELNNNIAKNARELAHKLLSGKERDLVSADDINRVMKAFSGSATGRIIAHGQLPKVPSDMSLYGNAFWNQIEEISRNETAFAVVFRTVFAIPTGGGSELFFQTHKGYLRMRDYVDEGGDSVMGGALTATWGAVKDFAVSKASDKLMKGITPKVMKNKPIGKVDKFLKDSFKDPRKLDVVHKIIYNQVKRAPRAAINKGDEYTLNVDGNIRSAIKRIFD